LVHWITQGWSLPSIMQKGIDQAVVAQARYAAQSPPGLHAGSASGFATAVRSAHQKNGSSSASGDGEASISDANVEE
jgi:hypothetical protein